MAHLSEQAAAGDNNVLPCVVVLDNLHKAGPLADALGSLPRNLPCLLGKKMCIRKENNKRMKRIVGLALLHIMSVSEASTIVFCFICFMFLVQSKNKCYIF